MLTTQEWIPGVGFVTQQANFRSYDDPSSSSADYWKLLQNKQYADVRNAPDFRSALSALGKSGYATDPAYATKVGSIAPSSPAQQAFFDARKQELLAIGVPEHIADLGARQSALETGWGKSAPGQNYYGIKAPNMQVAQAGRSDVPQGLMPLEAPTMGGQAAPGAPAPIGGQPMGGQPPMPQQQPPGFFDKLNAAMSSPLFMTGASILANNTGNYGAWAPAIGRGLVGGQMAASAMQEDQAQSQLRQLQMAAAKERQAEEERAAAQVEEWISTLDPKLQRFARAFPEAAAKIVAQQELGASPAQYGVQPHYERDPEGNIYEVRYANDGTKKVTKLDRMPFAVESRSPEFIGEQATRRAEGTEKGRATAEALNKYSDEIAQIQNTQQTIEELAGLPGRSSATGIGSAFPSWPGGDAANYEAKFAQLKGQNFLAMIPNMKGMGALSNAEGDALREAATDLKLAQGDEQHARSLAKLYAVLNKGMERIRTRKLLGPGQEVQPPSQAEIEAIQARLFGGRSAPAPGGWKIERVETGGGY